MRAKKRKNLPPFYNIKSAAMNLPPFGREIQRSADFLNKAVASPQPESGGGCGPLGPLRTHAPGVNIIFMYPAKQQLCSEFSRVN